LFFSAATGYSLFYCLLCF